MRRILLRTLLVFDAAALLLLGAAFILAPARALSAFGFSGAPPVMSFILGVFGTVYVATALGCAAAAWNPMRNELWVQVTIIRGAAESLFSIVCVLRGIVTFRQGGLGIVLPALIAIACLALYPRPEPPPPGSVPVTEGAS